MIAALPPPVGWKFERCGHAHGVGNRHATFSNVLCAWHADLIDSAVIFAAVAQYLVDLLGVDIKVRWRSWQRRRQAF